MGSDSAIAALLAISTCHWRENDIIKLDDYLQVSGAHMQYGPVSTDDRDQRGKAWATILGGQLRAYLGPNAPLVPYYVISQPHAPPDMAIGASLCAHANPSFSYPFSRLRSQLQSRSFAYPCPGLARKTAVWKLVLPCKAWEGYLLECLRNLAFTPHETCCYELSYT